MEVWSARRVRWAASDAVLAEVLDDGSGCLNESRRTLGRTLGLVQPTYREAEIAWRALGPARTRTGDPRSSRPRCELFGAEGGRAHPAASVEAPVASARCTQGRGRAVLLGGCKCSPSDGGGETPVWRVDVAARGGECTGTALLTDACGTTVPRVCAQGREAGAPLGAALLTGAVPDDGAARVRTGWRSRRAFGRGERRTACVYKQWRERTGGDPWD